MTEDAFDLRLRDVGQLYRLWVEIEKARRAGPIAKAVLRDPARKPEPGAGSASPGGSSDP